MVCEALAADADDGVNPQFAELPITSWEISRMTSWPFSMVQYLKGLPAV